jgi:hypothetical protein
MGFRRTWSAGALLVLLLGMPAVALAQDEDRDRPQDEERAPAPGRWAFGPPLRPGNEPWHVPCWDCTDPQLWQHGARLGSEPWRPPCWDCDPPEPDE